jgi:phage repressor protein C with HTH and peptisase S24 domain
MDTLGNRIKQLREQMIPKMSQRALGEACGWGASSQARVGNYESNLREPSIGDLRKLAEALGTTLTHLIGEDEAAQAAETQGDYAVIPQYSAKGATGNGFTNDHVEVRGGLVFKRDWLRRMGLNPNKLRVIYAAGMSMEPTISDGDVLLVDESQTTPANAKIYALLRPDGDVSIKRLIQAHTGGWIIRSDNQNKTLYPDEPAQDTEIGHLQIQGRIVWHGGAL